MPIDIRKLTQEEAVRFFPGGSAVPAAEYVDALRELRPGDYAEAPKGTLTSRAFKRRLTLAAKHLGLVLKYGKDDGDEVVRFQVRQPRTPRTQRATPSGEAPRRRGRPPKNPPTTA